jgi:hypothetical protein
MIGGSGSLQFPTFPNHLTEEKVLSDRELQLLNESQNHLRLVRLKLCETSVVAFPEEAPPPGSSTKGARMVLNIFGETPKGFAFVRSRLVPVEEMGADWWRQNKAEIEALIAEDEARAE